MNIFFKEENINKLFGLRNVFTSFSLKAYLKYHMKKTVLSKCAILFYAITCIRKYYPEEIWTEKVWANVFKQTEKANKQWYGEKFSVFFLMPTTLQISKKRLLNKLAS